MRRPWTTLAVVVASLVFAAVFIPWGNSASRAFAQVQQAVREASSIALSMQTFEGEELIDTRRVWYRPDGMMRAEGAFDLHVVNAKSGEMLSVDHARKAAKIQPVYDMDSMRKVVGGAMNALGDMRPIEGTGIREERLGGRVVQEFKAVWDGSVVTVLADAGSRLPIRLEVDRGEGPEGRQRREVIESIRFDVPLDEADFLMIPPKGYKLERVERREPKLAAATYVLSTDKGLGPVQFGMSVDEVRSVLGPPEGTETRPGMEAQMKDGKPVIVPGKGFHLIPADPPFSVIELRYDAMGFRIGLTSTEGVTHIRCFEAKTYGPASRRFLGETSNGIKIGMDRAEIESRLGGKVPLHQFEFKHGKCSVMRASRKPEGR
ncbi:MAG: hypothetical protein AAF989_07495 [Planctomycetota bacterium]